MVAAEALRQIIYLNDYTDFRKKWLIVGYIYKFKFVKFEYLEKNKVKFSKRDWNKTKKMKVEEPHFCYQMGRYLIKLGQ